MEALVNRNITTVVCHGPSGTGKTLFACDAAYSGLLEGSFERIILTRPMVGTGDESIGALPGDLVDKMSPWMRPFYEAFRKLSPRPHQLDHLMADGRVEMMPLSVMRGCTFDDCFVIADEMQNSTSEQMKMFLERAGKNSKFVVLGDQSSCDLGSTPGTRRRGGADDPNGLDDFLSHVSRLPTPSARIAVVELALADVQRSEVVKEIQQIYRKGRGHSPLRLELQR
jgi:phosphate starvation-inducible PhoH-like protein